MARETLFASIPTGSWRDCVAPERMTGSGWYAVMACASLVFMSDQNRLTLWFEGGDDLGQFNAMVSANGFSGETGYVVFPGQVREFLRALAIFPISVPVALTIGEEFEDGPLLALVISPNDRRGSLRVRVSLAADDDRTRRVSTDFLSVYSDVERFARAIESGLQSGGTAVLTAHQS
ncbi:MAG: hypothetical protein ACKO1O_11175 [Erythrobacter sp.]